MDEKPRIKSMDDWEFWLKFWRGLFCIAAAVIAVTVVADNLWRANRDNRVAEIVLHGTPALEARCALGIEGDGKDNTCIVVTLAPSRGQ